MTDYFKRRQMERELEEALKLQRRRHELNEADNRRRINLLLKHAEFLLECGLDAIAYSDD